MTSTGKRAEVRGVAHSGGGRMGASAADDGGNDGAGDGVVESSRCRMVRFIGEGR